MAQRSFFGPAQKESSLYSAENDQLQQRPSFHAAQAASSSHAHPPASPAHAYPSSSLSHDGAYSNVSYEAYRRHNQHSYDHHQHKLAHALHNYEYCHLLDELRTCARLKAEIVAHPLFDDLLEAHVQCLSVGISSHEMQAMEAQLANSHNIINKYRMLGKNVDDQGGRANALITPGGRREIDAFMGNYIQLLLSWKRHFEDLIIPQTKKALATLCEIEQAFCDLTGVSTNEISSGMRTYENWEDMFLDLELHGGDYGIDSQSDIDRSLLEHVQKELKSKLKEGYRDCIQAIKEEIVRKRQVGKLPGDLTPLKKWWNAHSRWPYPTEEEKKQLMEETGLEMRQINNCFINHRKRNWIDRQPPPTSNAASAGFSPSTSPGPISLYIFFYRRANFQY